MIIFDSHAHYDDERYDEDRDEVLSSLREKGVGYVVNCGSDIPTSESSLALAEKYPFVYASVGIHPGSVSEASSDYIDKIKELALCKKCVAIGEIGMDYHYGKEFDMLQRETFAQQIRLAKSISKPVIIHEREAYFPCMEIIKREKCDNGVMHCFSGNKETLKEVLAQGLFIGVGGTLTFKNNVKTVEMCKYLPLDKMMLETDCPYLSPTPFRGERNSSERIELVAEKVAEIKNISVEEVIEVTRENAKKFYGIV